MNTKFKCTTHSTGTITRRNMLLTGAGVAGTLLGRTGQAATPVVQTTTKASNVYEAIGVTPIINAAGTLTALGGSLMPDHVIEAWVDASRHFVDLRELGDKVGSRIAELIGVEAALVTTGAAGAMLLATAAAMTRGDEERVRQLPDSTGMRNEVITQKTHHTCYDNQIRACGATLIDVETRNDLEAAISDRTALMLFYNLFEPDGQIKREDWIAVARTNGIPTLLDAAADVPPLEALSMYNEMGFDMVAFSGGKALRGPNDTGLLLGREDLITAASRNNAPNCGTLGRSMKVGKEAMIAALAAIERYVNLDHSAEQLEWENRLATIETTLKDIPTVSMERFTPPIANRVPHLLVFWDENRVKIDRDAVTETLASSNPPIRLGRVRGTGDQGLLLSVFMLKPGETEFVAKRLHDVLLAAVV